MISSHIYNYIIYPSLDRAAGSPTRAVPYTPRIVIMEVRRTPESTSRGCNYLPPEVLHSIFSVLGNESYVGEAGYQSRRALASCMLVNKLWASVATPFLWKKVGFYPYKTSLPQLLKGISDPGRRQEYVSLIEEAAIFQLCYDNEVEDCRQMLRLVTFPRLKQLHLRNVRLDKCIPAIQAPALEALSLDSNSASWGDRDVSPQGTFTSGVGHMLALVPRLRHLKIIDLENTFADEELVVLCHIAYHGLSALEHIRPERFFHDAKMVVVWNEKGEVIWQR